MIVNQVARVVIGAGYGDEGKGIITARLAHILHNMSINNSITPVVVRFNGGAQASHTVEAGGFRHAFSHFGSGTLSSPLTKTHLSDQFIVNVDLFMREKQILNSAGYYPAVSVDPRAKVTLPIDIIINQLVELTREKRHGSCGLGINETVTRYERWCDAQLLHDGLYQLYRISPDSVELRECNAFGCQLTSADFENSPLYQWFRTRLSEHGLTERDVLKVFKISNYSTCVEFIGSVMAAWFVRWNDFITSMVLPRTLGSYRRTANSIVKAASFIFEGAQGLELDEVNGNFPHVTRSRTGSTNVISALREISRENDDLRFSVDLHYVSRIYKTRHGAGPLAHEKTIQEMTEAGYNIHDLTNVPNEFQGTLRYALLDIDALHARINEDLRLWAASGIYVRNKTLEITCVDQLNDLKTIRYILNDEPTVSHSLDHFQRHGLKAFIEDDFQITFHYSPAIEGAKNGKI